MEKEELKSYLSSKYQGSKWFLENVIHPVFGDTGDDDVDSGELLDKYPELQSIAKKTGISSIKEIWEIFVGMQPLLIFDVTVADHIMMNRNRVGVQTIVKRIMDKYSYAFMIFHYDNDTQWDWRFSYCHKGSKESDTTESKRFTFLLGPGQSCLTAASNFMKLEAKHGDISNDDLETAFSVEALSNEFFDKYKKRYEKFVSYITGKAYVKSDGKYMEKVVNTNNDKVLYAAFGNDDKRVRDYVKRLLGRIVFLHFLQKKGWLGLSDGEDWDSGKGDLDFMRRLYNEASPEQQDDFLDTVLEPLFSAIDTNRSASNYLYDTKVLGRLRVPYLNGGLFERNADDEIPSRFPKEYFADLLEFFSQYNFTVDENDPNDAQVGIDPEMLSRIFENLLEDNKDKGAYYTPKEVVHYMCRESLIAYLQTSYDEDKCKAIRKFVETHNASTIESFKKDIDTRLQEVKICDPAIGSGAFPMGMLKEIFLCRCALEEVTDNAEIKRQIIQNNIYGVDIEKGAVEIARLRFWLTLIVDEKSPETLPNLDFKIMQGNSLLESYEGIDLSRLSVISDIQFFEPQRNLLGEIENREIKIAFTQSDELRDFQENVNSYFAVNDHAERLRLRNAIEDYLRKTIKQTLERYQRGEEIYIENIISTNITLNEKQKKVIEARKKVIQHYKKIIAEVPQMEMTNSHFFLWHTWFNDVFSRPSKEGFDIVIGNPPYGATYSKEQKSFFKKNFVTAQTKKGIQKGSLDTYTLFIEQGFNLLSKNGVLAYIVPISITSSDSVTGVHRMLLKNCNTIYVSSFAVRPKPVFENAMVNTSILMMRKTSSECEHLYATKMYRRDGGKFSLANLMSHLRYIDVKSYLLYGRIPKISLPIEKQILHKLNTNSMPIGKFIVNSGFPIVYRFAGGRYFKVVTNYAIGSSAERTIYFESQDVANSIGCILSSNLSFWFYQIYSDNLNWKGYEIENFRIPHLSCSQEKYLSQLYEKYLQDIEEKANVRQANGSSSYNVTSFKEYKIVRSKSIIDEIDDYIGPLYGLNSEEIEFVKNYELRFRMSGE